MSQKAKMIQFAYPSSPLAVSAGYATTGCWYIILYPSIDSSFSIGKPLHFFEKKEGAKVVADLMPEPYNKNIARYFEPAK